MPARYIARYRIGVQGFKSPGGRPLVRGRALIHQTQFKGAAMKQLGMLTMAVAFVVAGAVRAEDKPNPTGTWKWTVERMGNKRDVTLKLKLEGDKLTGAMPGRGNNPETAI